SAVRLLPDPDSPTIPNVSPACTCNDTPSTGRPTPRLVKRWVCRFRTSRTTGPAVVTLNIPQVRIEPVANPITDQVVREHRQHDVHARKTRYPPCLIDRLQPFSDHSSPSGSWRRHPRAQKRQRSFHDNGPANLQRCQNHQRIDNVGQYMPRDDT